MPGLADDRRRAATELAATVSSNTPRRSASSISRPTNGVSCVRVRSTPRRARGAVAWKTRTGSLLPFRSAGGELLVVEDERGRLAGRRADGDAHLGRDRLDARRGVDRVAGEEPLAGPGVDAEPDERLAGVDADPEPKRRAAEPLERLGLVGDPKGGADRALGVVLMRDRHAEDADDRVADELLDDAAVELDLRAGHREVGGRASGRRPRDRPSPIVAVKPTRSQNSAVTTLRSSATGETADPSGVAHSMQNFAASGFS